VPAEKMSPGMNEARCSSSGWLLRHHSFPRCTCWSDVNRVFYAAVLVCSNGSCSVGMPCALQACLVCKALAVMPLPVTGTCARLLRCYDKTCNTRSPCA
jgi:hypothetical protein